MTFDRPGRPSKSDYVTLAEAAGLLDVSERTVQRMMTRGQLTYRRTPGGQRRIHRSSLEKYIASPLDKGDTEG